ncbi:MAG: thermonuclease family protein [Acidiferrobacterales bacterium]
MGAFFVFLLSVTAFAASAQVAEVRHVIDGDSLQLVSRQQVRMIGVNTPEMHGADDRPEPFALQARDMTKRLIGNQPVQLIPGAEKYDHYHRLLAYVETGDGRDIPEQLLAEGLGFLVAIPPNLARLNRYQAAQERARSAGRGIWSVAAYAPIPADGFTRHDPTRGFKQVSGKITGYNRSRRYYYFKLSPNFEIKVPREYWIYFDMTPDALVGKSVVVRGWITQGKYRLQMRVSHPAMMDISS